MVTVSAESIPSRRNFMPKPGEVWGFSGKVLTVSEILIMPCLAPLKIPVYGVLGVGLKATFKVTPLGCVILTRPSGIVSPVWSNDRFMSWRNKGRRSGPSNQRLIRLSLITFCQICRFLQLADCDKYSGVLNCFVAGKRQGSIEISAMCSFSVISYSSALASSSSSTA